jgi:hypothetical protein
VILCVHAYAAHLTNYPFFGQRPWPVGIDNEFGTVGVCLRAAIDSQDRQGCAKPNLSEQAYFLFRFASHTEADSEPRVNFCGSTSFACDSRYLDMTLGVRPNNSDLHVCPRRGTMQSWHQHFGFSKTPNPRDGGRQARSMQGTHVRAACVSRTICPSGNILSLHPRNSKQKAAPNFVSKCGLQRR